MAMTHLQRRQTSGGPAGPAEDTGSSPGGLFELQSALVNSAMLELARQEASCAAGCHGELAAHLEQAAAAADSEHAAAWGGLVDAVTRHTALEEANLFPAVMAGDLEAAQAPLDQMQREHAALMERAGALRGQGQDAALDELEEHAAIEEARLLPLRA
jgi:hypothetical protein